MCLKNGAFSVYSRNLENNYVNTENPLYEVIGNSSLSIVYGQNIGIIESSNEEESTSNSNVKITGNDYLFITKDENGKKTEIEAFEFIYFQYTEDYDDKGPDIFINQLNYFKRIYSLLDISEQRKNYGQSINLVAGVDLLILNHLHFDKFRLYYFCGINKYYSS